MNRKKTALILAAAMSLTALASCGAQAPAVSATAAETAQTAEQTTEQTTAAPETTAETTSESSGTTDAEPEKSSDRVDIPENERDGYNEKIYAANQRAAVFKNHRSLTIAASFGIDPGENRLDFSWYTKDYTYYSAPAYEELSFPDVRYELVGIGSDYNPVATYYLDMIEGGYQYWPVPKDINEWLDSEHETCTDMYIQDGKLYFDSVYDEAGSEHYFSTLLPQTEYTGGIVRYSSVIDAETFETLEASTFLEKDGNTEPLITEHYKYDGDVPVCLNVIAGAFERYSPNTVTVTATAHPGTDKEITKSITVPSNSMVSFYTPDMTSPEYFRDRECTEPYTDEWDMMSDLTLYIRDGEAQE